MEQVLPPNLDVFIPESRLHAQLLSFQQRLISDLTRTNIALNRVKDSSQKQGYLTKPKVLRLFLYNSHENQDETAREGDPPRWTMRVHGQILDPDTLQPSRGPHYVFSNVVRRVVVHLDSKLFPATQASAEWNKSTSSVACDGFEVKRNGDENCVAHVSLFMESCPACYKLSPPLRDVVNMETGTRADVITALWEYIQTNSLQLPSDPVQFTPDEKLAKMVGESAQSVYAMWDTLSVHHLLPPDPLVFKYTVRVDSENPQESLQCYDIPVVLPDMYVGIPHSLSAHQQQVEQAQKDEQNFFGEFQKASRRREYLLAFAEAPVDAVRFAVTTRTVPEKTQQTAYLSSALWLPDAVDRYFTAQESEHE